MSQVQIHKVEKKCNGEGDVFLPQLLTKSPFIIEPNFVKNITCAKNWQKHGAEIGAMQIVQLTNKTGTLNTLNKISLTEEIKYNKGSYCHHTASITNYIII